MELSENNDENCVILDTNSILESEFDAKKWIDSIKNHGIKPLMTEVSAGPSYEPVVIKEQYDLLMYLCDCAVSGIISVGLYHKFKNMMTTSTDPDIFTFIKNTIDAQCSKEK